MRPAILRAAAGLALLGAVCMATASATVPAAAPVPAPPAARLMALAFPGWHEGAGGRRQTATLPVAAGGAHGGYAGWSAGSNRVLAEPALVLRLDADRLLLIAGLAPANADGRPAAAQLTPMALAAYRFERRGDAWRLAGSQDIFALRGFAGTARLRAVTLSDRRQAVAVEYGSCFDGYCGNWLALYELDGDAVRHEPAVELALSGINVDSSADCAHRLEPLVKQDAKPQLRLHDAALRDTSPADAHDCYTIDGNWTLAAARGQPGDLVIRYQGAISRADAHPAAPVAIDQRQVLRYEGGRYRAVSGFNPVPAI